MIKKRYRLTLIIASSILLILAYPNFNFEFLAWIGLVPLFFAVEKSGPVKAFLVSYLAGVLFFLGVIYWLIHVTLPGMVVVVLYLALYFGAFGSISSYALSNGRYAALFFIPAAWVTLEWVRSNLFGGFGWALMSHSQSYNLPIIQIADIFGAYGVSFLVVSANLAIFSTLKNIKKRAYPSGYIVIAAFLVFLALTYGVYRLNNIFTGERFKISVIQGNIPQSQKWDADFKEEILNKYESLTRQAAGQRPDLIIWPETSVPGYLETETKLSDRIKSLARETGISLFVGAPREDLGRTDRYYNSAILFSPEGQVIGCYDKIHLVPFGEYIPFRNIFSFVETFARTPIGDFSSGGDFTVLKFLIERSAKSKDSEWKLIKKVKFSCLICFEDIFPGLVRQFVKRGALFLVNITNDAWFWKTSAAYQHAQSSVFRAVENRVNVVRAANTGLSCFIDQKGRIVETVKDGKDELFVSGFKTHEIVLTHTRTFYTSYGDLFAYICAAFSLIYVFAKLRPR